MKSTPSSVSSQNLISNDSAAGMIAEPLRALRRALTREDGFALYIAVVKTPSQRNELIKLLQEAVPMFRLQVVTIRPQTTDILDEIVQQLGEKISDPIMLVGIENVLSYESTNHPIFHALNLRRPDWPRFIKQPVVFWVPEHLLGLISRAVPDFLDWRSDTLHFPDLDPTQVQMLYSSNWKMGMDTQMPVGARIERVKELESRIASDEHSRDPIIISSVANWLNELGVHLNLLGRILEAHDCFKKAVSFFALIGDKRSQSASTDNLGDTYRFMGDLKTAMQYYERALETSREISDKHIEGTILGNIGVVFREQGSTAKAIEFFEQQLRISREIIDRRGEANAIEGLALVSSDVGDWPNSLKSHNRALQIYREISDRRNEGNVLNNLAIVYKNMGEMHRALELYEERLKIAREIGDRRGEGNSLGNLANAYNRLGDSHKAIELFEQHLNIAKETGDRLAEGHTLGNLGIAYKNLGDMRKAAECFEQSIKTSREFGDRRGEAHALWSYALLFKSLNNRAKAIDCAEAALKDFEYFKDPRAILIREELERWRGEK